jgi:polyisoprenoid-binding protein YceI
MRSMLQGPLSAGMRIKLGVGAALAALLVTAVAEAKLARGGPATTTFTATGPGGLKIIGTTSDLDVLDDGQTVTISVPLANLSTGISLRDKHMKEKYLEVPKFPNATFKVPRSALPAAGASGEADVPGTMNIHGQNHPVTVHFKSQAAGATSNVDGTAHVNMKDYGIDVPSYLGVTVKPDVDLAVHFVAKDG